MNNEYISNYYNFYPRSHVGNDFSPESQSTGEGDFYPRSHVGNDMMTASNMLHCIPFLSTFPRRERPPIVFTFITSPIISIHVPT